MQDLLVPGKEGVGQKLEDLRVNFIDVGSAQNPPAIVYGGRTVLIYPSRRLNIRDTVLDDSHFTRPSIQVILPPAGQRIKALVIPSLSRDGQLLQSITEDNDHERQAYDKPHRLDGGVQLVAGEEFQVTLHTILSSVPPPDWSARP